jgi:hypothetical protein
MVRKTEFTMKRVAFILVLTALLVGCSRIRSFFDPPTMTTKRIGVGATGKLNSPERTAPQAAVSSKDRNVQKDLEDLGVYLMAQVQRTGRPAGSLAEATVLAEQDPALYVQVKAGVYIVRWGIEPKAFGAAVIAYEPQTPTKGGYVLLGGANVTKATPQEFKSALNNRD